MLKKKRGGRLIVRLAKLLPPHGRPGLENLMNPDMPRPAAFASPYLAGTGLGLTLLASYGLLGTGLGASSAIARCAAWLEQLIAPRHVAATPYFSAWFGTGAHVLGYYLVAMGLGVLAGGFLSALGARRIQPSIERGDGASPTLRLALALGGGVLAGFASRLARGCTSGQALSGTALLFSGSVAFLGAMFATAFLAARFVRSQWR